MRQFQSPRLLNGSFPYIPRTLSPPKSFMSSTQLFTCLFMPLLCHLSNMASASIHVRLVPLIRQQRVRLLRRPHSQFHLEILQQSV